MKILILLLLISGKLFAQKPINFVVVYKDTSYEWRGVHRVAGFANTTEVNAWLNSRGMDSSLVVGVYNLQRNTPLRKTYTEERQKVEVVRQRKWNVRL